MFQLSRQINKIELLQAIDQASDNLRNILDSEDVQFILADQEKRKIKSDYKKQWQGLGIFRWKKAFKSIGKHKNTMLVSLYSGDLLCGLCELNVTRDFLLRRSVEINVIEGNPKDHPLKGLIAASFSHVALRLAQRCNFNRVSVFDPEPPTIPLYLKAGFKKSWLPDADIAMKVTAKTELDWQTIADHQKVKGRFVPNGYQ